MTNRVRTWYGAPIPEDHDGEVEFWTTKAMEYHRESLEFQRQVSLLEKIISKALSVKVVNND